MCQNYLLSETMYLGPLHHLAVGIRIPEVLLRGILEAFKERNHAGTLMLSFARETAPEYVINAPPGKYEITRGHSGTSIKKYLTLGFEKAKKYNALVELEADHVTVTDPLKAVKRISGIKVKYGLSDSELKRAMEYVKSEVDEAISTKYVDFFTLDTCELVNLEADKLSEKEIETLFSEKISEKDGKKIIEKYVNRDFVFIGSSGKPFRIKFNEKLVKRLVVKYLDSINLALELYNYIRMKMFDLGKPFGIEIALDELPELTKDYELLFYLKELNDRGLRVDYIAPNIGFKKKKDYTGSLVELRDRVERLSAIARSFGCLLSFHSGGGEKPFSGKGPGVFKTLLKATNHALKYKISGSYVEIILEIMEKSPPGSKPRRLYEEIFTEVYNYLRECLDKGKELCSPVIAQLLEEYDQNVKKGIIKPYSLEAEFFKRFSFIALNIRDKAGRRYLREGIVELYENDPEFKLKVNKYVKLLTIYLIDGLKFYNNINKLAWWKTN